MLLELRYQLAEWAGRVPRGWRYAGVALLALLAVLAVARVASGGHQDTAGTAAAATAAQRDAGTPADGAVMLRRDGNAVLGVLRSNDGAVAAALSYTQQRNALLTGGTSSAVAAEVGSKLAPGGHDIGDRPAGIPDRAARQNAEAMLATRQGTLSWFTTPIAYRVRSYSDRRAVVRVYASLLSVGATPEEGAAAITYTLRDVTLTWSGGAWRIRSVKDTPDQPTPAFVAATDSSADAANRPIRDRVIRSTRADGVGLHDWLAAARPMMVGPQGMGSLSGAVRPEDRNVVGALARGMRKANRTRTAGFSWASSTPIAYRASACPGDTEPTVRCYEVLTHSTGYQGRGVALSGLQLAGLAVSTDPNDQGSTKYDLPATEQQKVLGGRLTIPVAGLPDSKTTNAAWQRSIQPLTPTLPASAR